MRIREDKLEELEKLGFKPDKRKNILYSITDELFGDVIRISTDREIYRGDFSDGIVFKLMEKDFIER